MDRVTRIFDLLELFRNEYSDSSSAFSIKRNGRWISYSAADYIGLSNRIAMGLIAMGVKRGDRIATILLNCPEWNFFDMGIMMAGAVQVPIYPSLSEENYRYILNDANIEYLIISNQEIFSNIKGALKDCPSIRGIFSISGIRGVKSWEEILRAGDAANYGEILEERKRGTSPADLATIIYTSGTTGRPKGVMLSHTNFISNFTECAKIPDMKRGDRALSFLPLCHVYERMLNYVYQLLGMSVCYAESIDKLAENIREIRPHTFATVPRVLEKIYNRIVAKARSKSFLTRMLFFWALKLGHRYELGNARGWVFCLKLQVADFLVFRKWRKALGGNIRLIISGGASLHPSLARLFWAAKLYVMEGYGLTETSPVIAVYNFGPGGVKFGTVGPILPGVEVRIGEDGEILCKGPNVMLGYYNRPERTEEVIDSDGWFHTGDIGVMEDGIYLKITDRKKEIFKTSTGRYIAPHVIEMKLAESPFIEHVMVIGENRKYTAALIVPNFEYLSEWCRIKGLPFRSREKTVKNPRIIKRIMQEVRTINADLGQTEKIKKIRLLADEWSVATGELSPTLKFRRKFVLEKYSQIIEETYKSSEFDYRSG